MAPPPLLTSLPRGPALVLAAALSASPAAAVEPPPDAIEEALVSVDFAVEGSGPTEAEAVADARAKAVALAFERLQLPYGVREHVLGRHRPAEWLAERPGLFPFIEEERAIAPGEPVTARLRLSLTGEAFTALQAAFSVVGPSHVGDVAVDPLGQVIVIRSPEYRIAGARLISADGHAIEDLDDARGIAKSFALVFERAGTEVTVPIAVPIEPDVRDLAPTCGPCCHGHCEDEDLPYPIPDRELD